MSEGRQDTDTDTQPSTLDGLSSWFGRAAQIITGLAGASYAFGWMLAARFYGSFGVAPEDVGISFERLAIRAFVVGAIGLSLFLGVRWLLSTATRGRTVIRIVESRAAIFLIIFTCCIGVSLVVAFLLATWVTYHGDPVSWVSVISVLVCGVAPALLILWLKPPSVQIGWNSSLWLRGMAGAVLGFVVAGLILLPYRLGDHLASSVRAGTPVTVPVVPGIAGLEVTRVRLSPVDDSFKGLDPLLARSCLLRLGAADGTSIYYMKGRILRIADSAVAAVVSC